MRAFEQAKTWARHIKRDVVVVYFAARDPRTPMMVRVLAIAVAAYALSPIDLIPDFIPVLGYLDDLVIVPIGLLVVIRLLPPEVLESARVKAEHIADRPTSRTAAALIVCTWLLCIVGLWYFLVHE
ncbi:MAG: YkvA family protein [Burkholderiaceae bacterium]